MSGDNVLERLNAIFSDVMDIENPGLLLHSTASDYEDWDSLSNIRFIVAVEKAFGVKFSNGEIEAFRNVGDLVSAIRRSA